MMTETRVRTPDQPARARRRAALTVPAVALAVTACVAGGVVRPAPARAAAIDPPTVTQVQTKSIPLTQTNWRPGMPAGVTEPLAFNAFDPALGTLKSVTISASGTFEQSFRMRFDSAATITVQSEQNQIQVGKALAPGASPAVVSTLPAADTLLNLTTPDSSRSQRYTGPDFPKSIDFDPTTQNATAGPLKLTSAADLAMYMGAGKTIKFPAYASARSSFTSSTGNGFGGVTTRAGVNLELSYEYVPVPEPTALAVLGLGVASLFAVRRRGR